MNNSVSPPNYYILEHHGIKGQKWGIRRTPEQLGHDAIADPIDYGVAGYPLILTSTKNLKTKTAKAQPLSTYY